MDNSPLWDGCVEYPITAGRNGNLVDSRRNNRCGENWLQKYRENAGMFLLDDDNLCWTAGIRSLTGHPRNAPTIKVSPDNWIVIDPQCFVFTDSTLNQNTQRITLTYD